MTLILTQFQTVEKHKFGSSSRLCSVLNEEYETASCGFEVEEKLNIITLKLIIQDAEFDEVNVLAIFEECFSEDAVLLHSQPSREFYHRHIIFRSSAGNAVQSKL